jgi:hypothetical protein
MIPGDNVTRFEAAPDGTLIPIPDELPQGHQVRSDALVTINPRGNQPFYYVVIYNGPTDTVALLEKGKFHIEEVTVEMVVAKFEHIMAEAVFRQSPKAVKFAGLIISVIVSALTASPILAETRFRGYTEDSTPIEYVMLEPQD